MNQRAGFVIHAQLQHTQHRRSRSWKPLRVFHQTFSLRSVVEKCPGHTWNVASCSGNSSLFGVNKGGRLVFTTVLSVESAFNTPAKCPGQKHHRSDDYQQGCSQNKNTQKPDGSFWKHTKKWHFFYVCSLLGPHNFFSAHFFHKYDQTMTFVFPNVTY